MNYHLNYKVKRANVWLSPQAIFYMIYDDKLVTTFGFKLKPWLLWSFYSVPNWPYLPLPVAYTSFYVVTNTVCPPPHAIWLTGLSINNFLGICWSTLSPCPNWPSFPNPQVYTLPSLVIAATWLFPQLTYLIF